MTDLAFFRLPGGRAWLGKGPFTSLASPPPEGGAFYVNDFDLSDPLPWKKPAELMEVTAETLPALASLNGSAAPRVTWAKPATEWFKMAFRRIRREVLAKRLEKMVPVLTERGEIIAGTPLGLLDRLMTAPPNTWGYAFIHGGGGFLGATPELLFRLTGSEVETMALAGTAKPGGQDAFLTDVKEIEEHEIVARYLIDRLSALGEVDRTPRATALAAGLVHFQSRIRAHLRDTPDPDALIRHLHPTPAVGCLPREDHWLTKLRDYRTQLNVPPFFGAPFGFIELASSTTPPTAHIVVSIRGLSWDQEKINLPSGCGIVGGSAFDHEWRELRLKREAVIHMLGL